MLAVSAFQFYDHLDFDRYLERQTAHAYRRPGVPASVPEHLHEQVRAAVDYRGMLVELRWAVYHRQELYDPLHAAQVAELVLQPGDLDQATDLACSYPSSTVKSRPTLPLGIAPSGPGGGPAPAAKNSPPVSTAET